LDDPLPTIADLLQVFITFAKMQTDGSDEVVPQNQNEEVQDSAGVVERNDFNVKDLP